MTSAVANAIAITLDKSARASYDRAVALEDRDQAPPQTPHEFAQTLRTLQSLTGPGDPGRAVKVH